MLVASIGATAKSLVFTLNDGTKVYYQLSSEVNPIMRFKEGKLLVNDDVYEFDGIKNFYLSDEDAPNAIENVQSKPNVAFKANTEKRLDKNEAEMRGRDEKVEYMYNALRMNGIVTRNESPFNKKTYSQAGEDVIMFYALIMLGIPINECTYLDLGANRPIDMSNTYFFYEQGARGVLVEANCTLIPELKSKRSGDVVLNNCITGHSGDKIPFNVLNLDGLSKIGSVDEILAANPEAKLLETIDVETITVGDIVDKYLGGKAPVIMNLDIEGLEKEILDSIDFERMRPLFMIIEMIPYSTELTAGIKDNELLEYVKSKGYIEFAFTGINSIFIDEKKYKELISKKVSGEEAAAKAE